MEGDVEDDSSPVAASPAAVPGSDSPQPPTTPDGMQPSLAAAAPEDELSPTAAKGSNRTSLTPLAAAAPEGDRPTQPAAPASPATERRPSAAAAAEPERRPSSAAAAPMAPAAAGERVPAPAAAAERCSPPAAASLKDEWLPAAAAPTGVPVPSAVAGERAPARAEVPAPAKLKGEWIPAAAMYDNGERGPSVAAAQRAPLPTAAAHSDKGVAPLATECRSLPAAAATATDELKSEWPPAEAPPGGELGPSAVAAERRALPAAVAKHGQLLPPAAALGAETGPSVAAAAGDHSRPPGTNAHGTEPSLPAGALAGGPSAVPALSECDSSPGVAEPEDAASPDTAAAAEPGSAPVSVYIDLTVADSDDSSDEDSVIDLVEDSDPEYPEFEDDNWYIVEDSKP